MKPIKSTLNLQSPILQNRIKSLSIYPNDLPDKKHCCSPSSHTQLLSIPSSENIQKNPTFPIKPEDSHKKAEGRKDKKEISIRLNIQSEVIQNNYLQQQFNHKKHSSSSLLSTEDLLQSKERQITRLKKELASTKYQISYLLNEKNIKYTIEKIDYAEATLSDRLHKASTLKKKKPKEHSPMKSSVLITKNVRQFFRNNSKNPKAQSTKQLSHLNYLISPKHCYSSEGAVSGKEETSANCVFNNKTLRKTLEELQKRASKVFNMYVNMYNVDD